MPFDKSAVHPVPDLLVHVWLMPLDLDHAPRAELAQTLSVDERERARRFRFERDRRRFTAARGLARAILGHCLGIEPGAVGLSYGPHGKPCLATGHGVDLRFNASHSGDLALFAVTRGVEIGVDIELVRSLPDRQQLAERFFAPAEAASINGLPAEIRDQAFFTCWTRKEAVVKALGTGLSEPLDAFEVSVVPAEPPALRVIRASGWTAAEWSLHDLSELPTYAAAVAIRTACARVVLRRVSQADLGVDAGLTAGGFFGVRADGGSSI